MDPVPFGGEKNSLGAPVPPSTPHAISVSLPTWADNVEYEEGAKRIMDVMMNGYPRFFIHLSIQRLARICELKFGLSGERSLLLPTATVAGQCRAFMLDQAQKTGSAAPAVRLVQFLICPEDKQTIGHSPAAGELPCAELHIVLFPADAFTLAKQFWQHSGLGISSRLAEYCLSLLPDEGKQLPTPVSSPTAARFPGKPSNRHYSAGKGRAAANGVQRVGTSTDSPLSQDAVGPEDTEAGLSVYLEERFGRNLPITHGSAAKKAMRRRIAGVLVQDRGNSNSPSHGPWAGGADVKLGPSSRGVQNVTEDDVYLFPGGMAAIWHAHQLTSAVRPPGKSVCFGFPYTDTLKIIEKWGPGAHFLGFGVSSDIDKLEKILEEEQAKPPALFTEFPSNPLLRSPDLPRLRALADKHDFLIVVDETIGNFCTVDVLPYADIVVSSLSKIFSGVANVMGGSLVLNPKGQHYDALKARLEATYEDVYFNEDAIYMERNSRDFEQRIRIINGNAEAVCDMLRARSHAGGAADPRVVLKDVFYPKWTARAEYDQCRLPARRGADGRDIPAGGFGGLFSLTFTDLRAARAFFDALSCHKGPSLGTNFTLACPYTVLAHFAELDWAAQYGIEEGLVRVSVGMEEREAVMRCFEDALRAAEDAVAVKEDL